MAAERGADPAMTPPVPETDEELEEEEPFEAPEEPPEAPAEVHVLKQQLQAMMATITSLAMTIEQLKETINVNENKAKNDDKDKVDCGMIKLEGFNKKNMIKPPAFDMEPGNFINWNELFTTYMMSIDPQWEIILKRLQKVDTTITRDTIDNIQDELKMTYLVKKSANHAMYINLIGYTSGKTKSRVTANSIDMAFESYRYIYHKGKNATKMNIVIMKAEVLRPARANKVEDVEEKLNEWKEKQRYLEDVGEPSLNFDQKKTLLVSMLPTSVMDYMLKNPAMTSSADDSYDLLEAGLTEYLGLLDQQEKRPKGNVNSMQEKPESKPEFEYTEPWWDEYYGKWMCSINDLNAAAKRQRTEDDDDAEAPEPEVKHQGPGKAKGKGKGQKGKAVCFNCGEPGHFARDCPKPKGKGKGKNWIPSAQWTQYNPGFIPRQWSNWRPGYSKGKGKGDQGKGKGSYPHLGGMMPSDGYNLAFPQLGSVSSTNWCYDDWGWQDTPAQSPATSMLGCISSKPGDKVVDADFKVVKRKAAKFVELDCKKELHQAMSFKNNPFAPLYTDHEGLQPQFGPSTQQLTNDCKVVNKKKPMATCFPTAHMHSTMLQATRKAVLKQKEMTAQKAAAKKNERKVPEDDDAASRADTHPCWAYRISPRGVVAARVTQQERSTPEKASAASDKPCGTTASITPARTTTTTSQKGVLTRHGQACKDAFLKPSGQACSSLETNRVQDEHAKKALATLTKAKDTYMGACGRSAEREPSTWRRISIAVDSGACDNVISPDDVPEQTIVESEGSRKGECFFSATGEPIPNLGDIRLPMIMREGTSRGMLMRAAPVSKPLASVKKICQAGHTVVFDESGSYVVNKASGEVNWLREDDGNYMLDAWVPPMDSSAESFPRQPDSAC